MTLPRSRTPQGQAGVDAVLAAPGQALIASDFDGTLAPIVADPAAARAYPGAAQALARLGSVVGTVAIITGRPAADAVELGGFTDIPGLIVLGHYGAERWADGTVTAAPTPDGIVQARELLPGILAGLRTPGARIEDKGTALAVHTRQAADPAAALEQLRQPLADLAARTGLALEPGPLRPGTAPAGHRQGRGAAKAGRGARGTLGAVLR